MPLTTNNFYANSNSSLKKDDLIGCSSPSNLVIAKSKIFNFQILNFSTSLLSFNLNSNTKENSYSNINWNLQSDRYFAIDFASK